MQVFNASLTPLPKCMCRSTRTQEPSRTRKEEEEEWHENELKNPKALKMNNQSKSLTMSLCYLSMMILALSSATGSTASPTTSAASTTVTSCKSQSRTHLELTSLSQVIFEPSDICSSWQKMVRSDATTTTATTAQTMDPQLKPWLQIERLDLSFNNLTVLHDASGLGRLINLIELRITHNQLARCEESALMNLRNLQGLDLSHNRLPALAAKFFQPVRLTLKRLNMSFNSISVLVPSLFESLNRLESLDLSHNEITSHWINDALFRNLTQLHYLDLSFNKLTVLSSPTTFAPLSQLETLSLQHNELRQVPETIQHLRYLSSLDLSQNLIHEITNASYLSNCRSLFNLNLESNLLENITRDAFVDLPALKVLNLANNKIHHLDQQAFDYVPDLHALRLDSNRLVDFGQAFVNLRFLLMLNISSNRIASFDYAQIPLGLQWLDLHANRIDRLNNFYYTPSAQQQYAAAAASSRNNQPISSSSYSIGAQWQSMLRLTTLDASHNLIRDLDNTSLPESLETVQLNNNQIRSIASHTFASKSNLTRINLSHNQISALVYDALHLGPTATATATNNITHTAQQQKPVDMQLAGNPISCNCNTGWLTQLLLASSALLVATGNSGAQQQPLNAPNNEQTIAILSRQVPRIVDAAQVNCELTFARPTPFIADPLRWSPIGAAQQLAIATTTSGLILDKSKAAQVTFERQSELLASVHLCPYKSHCFALCYCCDFDACDCEMSCPENCSCYYDQTWSTNIVDCSATNQMHLNSHAYRGISSASAAAGLNQSSQQQQQQQPKQLINFNNIPEKIPMDVTMLYLDGLSLIQVRANALIGRRNLKSLFLNNSQIYSIEPKAFATQKSLRILQLNSNYLVELFGHEFEQQNELRELYLASNRLKRIANYTFSSLKSLQVLHLQNNQLHHMNFWSNFPFNRPIQSPTQASSSASNQLISLSLGSNPWSCECDLVESMLRWLQLNVKHLHDRKSIQCQYNRTSSLHLLPTTSLEQSDAFDMTMCLNHTVLYTSQPETITDYAINTNTAMQMPQLPFATQPASTSTAANTMPSMQEQQPLDEPMLANGTSFTAPNDEPSNNNNVRAAFPPGHALAPGYWAEPVAPPAFQYPPRRSASNNDAGLQSVSNASGTSVTLALAALLALVVLLIVLVSLVQRRRSMRAWLRASSFGHALAGKPTKGAGPGTPSVLKHGGLQYGVSSGASTSSSSGASSSLSHALCSSQNNNLHPSHPLRSQLVSSSVRTGSFAVSQPQHQHQLQEQALRQQQAQPLIVRNSTSGSHLSQNQHQQQQQQHQITYSGEDEKLFDAYVTYSKHDEQFVNDFLAPELECGQPSYRVALHYRDLPVTTNEFLGECIVETANASRKLIMVISEHMLNSEWMQFEFRAAHLEALRNTYRQRLVIVLLGPTSAAQLDSDLYQWLKVCPCIHWGDKMFWPRLRFALPELACSTINRQQPQYLRYQTTLSPASGANGATKSLLKSAGGLLTGAFTASRHPASGAMRPLPVPQQQQQHQEHHYAHLSTDLSASQQRIYQQPIYASGELPPATQQQQAAGSMSQAARESNPVHI